MTDAPQADRLTALQKLRGVTQTQMAVDLGVSGSYLSQVKSGSRPISTELAHRASTVYRVPMSFLCVQSNPVDAMPVTFWKKSSARARDESQVVETYNEALRLFRYTSTITDYRTARLPDPATHDHDIEAIAAAVRRSAGLRPHTPIKNMTRLCEKLGIGVIVDLDPARSDDPGDHTGLSRPAESERPLIAIVGKHTGDTLRWAIAHELFHIIADADLKTPLNSTRDQREKRAHAFAGALLVPEPIARQHLSETLTLQGYLRVKADYGVSVRALILRGQRLGLVSDQRVRSLYIQMSSIGWKKEQEPVPVAVERPLLLGQSLRRALGPQFAARVSYLIGTPVEFLQHWVPEDEIDDDEPVAGVVHLSDRAAQRRT